MLYEFYEPREIIPTPEQVLWILKELHTLKNGYWPTNPNTGGYVDVQYLMKTGDFHAYFENPIIMASEIEVRLCMAGTDGLMLKCIHAHSETVECIARHFRYSVTNINKRCEAAKLFCSGRKRKLFYKRSYYPDKLFY